MAKDFWDYDRREGYDNQRDSYDSYKSNYRGDYVTITETGAVHDGVNGFMRGVFGWMFFGLLITAAVGFGFVIALINSAAVQNIASSPAFMFSLIIAEMVAVFSLSLRINKISASTAKMLFVVYAALNGVTLTYIVLAYAGGTVTLALVMTAVFFGIMALYGYVTKSDLTRFGPILMAALVAVIIATIVNFFLKSPMMDYIICLVGLGVFAGLTAYDVKKIKSIYYSVASHEGGDMAAKLSVLGALALYLDFVNMFIYLLRLLGRKK